MKKLTVLFIGLVLAVFVAIVAGDLGDAGSQTSGAGDIWWMDSVDLVNAYHRVAGLRNQ